MPSPSATSPSGPREPSPTGARSRLGSWSVAAQGIALLGLGAFVLLEVVLADSSSVAAAVFTGLSALGLGALMVLAARALLMGRRWPRSLVVLVQVFAVPVSVSLVASRERWLLGVILLVWAIGTLAVLISESARQR